ncbi:MAG: T9SS C-terminal target domain-containing protein [Cryomorphaceae bacterium]|nr:T9SS C-terminal target domain-containing protein [Cryomorphaceae bacterium]
MNICCPYKSFFVTTGFLFVGLLSISQGVNAYARVYTISNTTLYVSSVDQTDDTFEATDRVIVMQMQDDVLGNTTNSDAFGGLGSINNAGVYEVATIASVGSVEGLPSTIVLEDALSAEFNTCSNCRVQIFTYPNLGTPDFTTSGNMEPRAWDGEKGGVLAFEVSGTLFLGHSISANGVGFRGGNRSGNSGGASCEVSVFQTTSTNYGSKGESIFYNTDANYLAGRGRMLNGGGGGSSHNGGGGGGGNYTSGGQGGPGWSSSGCMPGSGGLGGIALSGYITPNRIFLGGGGGGGQQNNGVGSAGGNGGGIIMIRAARIETIANSSILANGNGCADAGNDGAGGGGSGGSILLEIPEFVNSFGSSLLISASGGDGGRVTDSGVHAGGGGGGQGTVIFSEILPEGNVTTTTASGTGGCNVSNCSSRADNGSGVLNSGIITGSPSFLNIEWLEFNVKAGTGNVVKLDWRVKAETEAAFFIVERSFDLQHWDQEVTIKAGPLNQNVDSYAIQVPQMGFGSSTYYRIKRVDLQGDQSMSMIRGYSSELPNRLVKNPYPNPASDFLDIAVNGENVIINLLSADGKLIEHFSASGLIRLECSDYGAGIYFLECTSGATRELYRVIFE